MRIQDVTIDANATLGKGLLLTDVAPVYAYANGKRTDTVTAFKYTVAMSERSYDKIAIKIAGLKQMESPVDDAPEVVFDDLEIYIYFFSGKYNLGARAKSIRYA